MLPLKAVAYENMEYIVLTFLVSHWHKSPLNDDAPLNILRMDVTRLVFHEEMLPLKAYAYANMSLISTTWLVSQRDIFPLKANAA